MGSNIQPIVQGASIGGWEEAYTWQFPEGASQSFLIGAPLTMSSGGVVIVSSVTAPAIAGIALSKATGTTGSATAPALPVIMPYQEVVFAVCVDTTTTNNTAALGTGYPSQFTIGSSYQMLKDSTSGNYYMGSGTGSPVFQLLSYDASLASTINARVNVRILTSQIFWT